MGDDAKAGSDRTPGRSTPASRTGAGRAAAARAGARRALPPARRRDAAPYGYGRDENPTWTHLERAIGELDGGEAVVFASGMAAVAAVIAPRLRPGDVLVAPRDGYPGIRKLAAEQLEPRRRRGAARADRHRRDRRGGGTGATLVWVETPSNPQLDSCDLDAVIAAAHAAGALVARRQHGRHAARASARSTTAPTSRWSPAPSRSPGTPTCCSGAVSVRDAALAGGAARLALAHRRDARPVRGLARAPLARHARAAARALAGQRAARVAEALAGRDDVTDVPPGQRRRALWLRR